MGRRQLNLPPLPHTHTQTHTHTHRERGNQGQAEGHIVLLYVEVVGFLVKFRQLRLIGENSLLLSQDSRVAYKYITSGLNMLLYKCRLSGT